MSAVLAETRVYCVIFKDQTWLKAEFSADVEAAMKEAKAKYGDVAEVHPLADDDIAVIKFIIQKAIDHKARQQAAPKETPKSVVPMIVHGTTVYLPLNTGGFDIADCPNAHELAEFIGRACNAHNDLVRALQESLAVIERIKPVQNGVGTLVRGREALAKAGAA